MSTELEVERTRHLDVRAEFLVEETASAKALGWEHGPGWARRLVCLEQNERGQAGKYKGASRRIWAFIHGRWEAWRGLT